MRRFVMTAFAAVFGVLLASDSAWAQCQGIIRIFYNADGTVRRIRLVCPGTCPDGSDCVRDSSGNNHGGKREWCDCNRDGQEPDDCHTVLNTPGAGEGGGPPDILCAGRCTDSTELCEEMMIQRVNQRRGRYYEEWTCRCL